MANSPKSQIQSSPALKEYPGIFCAKISNRVKLA